MFTGGQVMQNTVTVNHRVLDAGRRVPCIESQSPGNRRHSVVIRGYFAVTYQTLLPSAQEHPQHSACDQVQGYGQGYG